MEEPRRTRKTMTTELPPNLLFSEILPRLPAKSVSRFKCVSKEWLSFLTSSDFSKIHLRHATTDDHHKFLFFSSSTTPTATFLTLDCEPPPDHDGVTAPRRPFPFKVGRFGEMTFIASFNGLVCVGVTERWYGYTYSDMILWNPCTGDYKKLPKPKSRKDGYYDVGVLASGLYYSESDDDYRLLRVTEKLNAYIYSLKSNSWRKLDSTADLQTIDTSVSKAWGASNVQNEKLYFLNNGGRKTIIRFDTKSEKFRELRTPAFSGDDETVCLNSMVLLKERKIHVCEIHSCGEGDSTELSAKLWRMDGDGDGDGEWRKVASYAIPRGFYGFEPRHLMSDGNWATLCRSRCHVYKVDPARDFEKTSYRVDDEPKGKYIETLVSPNPKY